MPQLSKRQLFERACEAIQASGWRYLVEDDSHPFRITAINDGERRRLIIYIWNTTHGGGAARPANEYRIQLTGVTPPLQQAEGYQTVLLGWAEDWYVFTAYDVNRHLRFSLRSPSIQINKAVIEKAIENGYGFYIRQNGEVVIAFRPEFLFSYLTMQDRIHKIPRERIKPFERILSIETGKVEKVEPDIPSTEPLTTQDLVQRVIRQSVRDSSFTSRVLRAYFQTCAMCGVQFKIVEAAHIVPFEKARNFSTRNGLALCPNHHKAYDKGIIGVQSDFRIVVNPEKLNFLKRENLIGGEEFLLKPLFKNIRLPQNRLEVPATNFLRIGLESRGWPSGFVV